MSREVFQDISSRFKQRPVIVHCLFLVIIGGIWWWIRKKSQWFCNKSVRLGEDGFFIPDANQGRLYIRVSLSLVAIDQNMVTQSHSPSYSPCVYQVTPCFSLARGCTSNLTQLSLCILLGLKPLMQKSVYGSVWIHLLHWENYSEITLLPFYKENTSHWYSVLGKTHYMSG